MVFYYRTPETTDLKSLLCYSCRLTVKDMVGSKNACLASWSTPDKMFRIIRLPQLRQTQALISRPSFQSSMESMPPYILLEAQRRQRRWIWAERTIATGLIVQQRDNIFPTFTLFERVFLYYHSGHFNSESEMYLFPGFDPFCHVLQVQDERRNQRLPVGWVRLKTDIISNMKCW